jgi:hypothetical protein
MKRNEPQTQEATMMKQAVRKQMEIEVAEIAETILRIETLEERKSDRLDFHDVGVAELKDALIAAYKAGRESVEQHIDQPR